MRRVPVVQYLMPIRRWSALAAIVFIASVGLSSKAFADEINLDEDPATLHIGTGAGTLCAMGCGGDPNIISPNVLSIFQNSGGVPDLRTPLLLILGIPNTSGAASAPVISSITEYDPYPGSGTALAAGSWALGGAPIYGWSGAGFAGNWLPSSPQVYQFLNLEPPNTNASNNATNWFGDAPAGTASFGIYVYAIDATLGDKSLFNVTFAGAGLADGTVAIAYGCDTLATDGSNRCLNGHSTYSTPYTEAGRVGTSVPEPSSVSLALSGFGLMAMVAALRRRKNTEDATF